MSDALKHWQEQLAAWALPERITAAAKESPWAAPVGYFSRRADRAVPTGVSFERAAQALRTAAAASPGAGDWPNATLLDVGSGAGAASLPLAPLVSEIVAVDTSEAMLRAFVERAEAAGVRVRTVLGRWPDVAAEVPTCDVVVCHHVAYNAPDLAAFALALDRAARRRVVVELTPRHPLIALSPLWRALHDLDRPDGPTAEDALAVLHEAGIEARLERFPRPPRPGYASFDELVASTRRRLCLGPERDEELIRLLIELGVDPADPQELAPPDDALVTLWWDPSRQH